MKVYVYPADTQGCGFYRAIWPAQVLRRAGHDITIMYPGQRGFQAAVDETTDEVIDVETPADADVMVFQRVTHRYIAQAIKRIRAKGIAVVIDLDDDLEAIDPRHPAFHFLHPKNNIEHNWSHARLAMESATLVTLSTPALQRSYDFGGHSRVVRNYVREVVTKLEHYDNDVIGWPGAVRSHPGDLQVMGNSIRRLITEGYTFKIVGPVDGARQALGLFDELPATGAVDIKNWPEAINTLGVGVAPLADTRFNRGKSWLKPLELAAVGVPVVMSNLPEYKKINDLGVGLLTQRPKEWYSTLKNLARWPNLRADVSALGRSVVQEHLTLESNAWRWLEVWDEALQLQRKTSRAGV